LLWVLGLSPALCWVRVAGLPPPCDRSRGCCGSCVGRTSPGLWPLRVGRNAWGCCRSCVGQMSLGLSPLGVGRSAWRSCRSCGRRTSPGLPLPRARCLGLSTPCIGRTRPRPAPDLAPARDHRSCPQPHGHRQGLSVAVGGVKSGDPVRQQGFRVKVGCRLASARVSLSLGLARESCPQVLLTWGFVFGAC
jgi:hypothetical protein